MRATLLFSLLTLFILGACSDSDEEQAFDVGVEPVEDAPVDPSNDAGSEPGDDIGSEPADDTGSEPGDDAGSEPADDAGSDASEDTGEPVTEEIVLDDQGAVCLGIGESQLMDFHGDHEGPPMEVGSTVEVNVMLDTCLGSCDISSESECQLHDHGDGVFVVSSSGAYTSTSPCPPDDSVCSNLVAHCGEIEVHDESFVVLHGDRHYYWEPGDERGCVEEGDDDAPMPLERSFEDEGRICFGEFDAGGQPQANMEAGEPFPVTFSKQACLSSSCTEDMQAQCVIDIDDEADEITLSTSGSYSNTTHLNESCTEDCNDFHADCGQLMFQQEGDYEVHHGEETIQLTIPGVPVCMSM